MINFAKIEEKRKMQRDLSRKKENGPPPRTAAALAAAAAKKEKRLTEQAAAAAGAKAADVPAGVTKAPGLKASSGMAMPPPHVKHPPAGGLTTSQSRLNANKASGGPLHSREANGYGPKFSPYPPGSRPLIKEMHSGVMIPKLLPDKPSRPLAPSSHAWAAYVTGGLAGTKGLGPGHHTLGAGRGKKQAKSAGKAAAAKSSKPATAKGKVDARAPPELAGLSAPPNRPSLADTKKKKTGFFASVSSLFGRSGKQQARV